MKNRSFICILLLLNMLFVASCGQSNLPEYAPDIVSTTYRNMRNKKDFMMHGRLTITMHTSGKETEYVVDKTVVSSCGPYEITVKTVTKEDGNEIETEYEYYNEKMEEENVYCFANNCWTTKEKGVIDSYQYVVPFGIYFSNIHSFTELAESDGVTVLQGKTAGENTVYALEDSGCLKRFALTGVTEEAAGKLTGITVKAWIDNDQAMLTKVEADMTETVKNLITYLFGEEDAAAPKIEACRYVIDQVVLKDIPKLSLPEEAKQTLENNFR